MATIRHLRGARAERARAQPVRRLGHDFSLLWAAYSASALGSAIGSGALGLVAVLTLDVATWQVSLLTALGALTSATLALPLGPAIEHRHKRPVMIATDLVRAVTLLSVPVAAWLGVLTYAQLCVVSVVSALGMIAFASASNAHLKSLVPAEDRPRANSRFESTTWTANIMGGPVGGGIVAAFGAPLVMALDAASFVMSASWVRRIRSPEPDPPPRAETGESRRRRWAAGWRTIFGIPSLRRMFFSTLLYNSGMLMVSPLETVLLLRDLHFAPWQYGLSMGLSCLGGLVGAVLAPRLLERFGERHLLRGAGWARTLWIAPLVIAPQGTWGVIVVSALFFLLLMSAGVFNPTFMTYRMRVTPDASMSRVQAAWSISVRVLQSVTVLLGGAIAATVGLRAAIGVAALICLSSAFFLPWRVTHHADAASPNDHVTPAPMT